jgi:hypothetical protein
MKLGDRIRWRISPDPVWRETLVLGEMAYSNDGEIILIGDAVHYLGCPINVAHCELIETRTEFQETADPLIASTLRETYLKRFPGALKP